MFVPTHSFDFAPAMKQSFMSLLILASASGVLATTASCSERPRQPDPKVKTAEVSSVAPARLTTTSPSPAVAPIAVAAVVTASNDDLFGSTSAVLERTTRDQAAELTPLPEQLSRMLDASIAQWKAQGGKTSPTSENKLELARTDFTQKVRTLTLAGEDTWANAKEDARSSLDQVRVAYEELLASRKRI